jgi:response regulator of citrate/malate metabolism
MKIKCIIIEDEPLAVEILQDFIGEVPFLELIAVCNDAFEAMQVLKDQKVDLIFLDLHLPKLKGLDFLGTLKSPPMVIITTAYNDFAVRSYEYNVLDYLLKPIEFSRFMVAINKVIDQRNSKNNLIVEQKNDSEITEL